MGWVTELEIHNNINYTCKFVIIKLQASLRHYVVTYNRPKKWHVTCLAYVAMKDACLHKLELDQYFH